MWVVGYSENKDYTLHSKADSMVERFNVRQWKPELFQQKEFLYFCNLIACHETRSKISAGTLFGRELRLPVDILFGQPEK